MSAIAQALGVPQDWVNLRSVEASEGLLQPGAGYACACEVRAQNDQLLAQLSIRLSAQDYAITYVRWGSPAPEELLEAARSFVSSCFPGWSDDMILQTTIRSPESFEQALTVTPSSATEFHWREKRDGAWTGTFVYASFIDKLPGWPQAYGGYVAQARSIEDVKIPRERAVEIALAEAGRRGLEEPEVKHADLYLDHHLWHFPHWMIEVAEPRPRGQATHPLHTGVMVDAVSGEVLDPGAMMPDVR